MLKLAKYAAVAAVAGGLGIVATEPASAWGYSYGYGGYGYDYGYSPYAYGFSHPGYYGYRPYRHHFYGYDGPGRFYRRWGW